MRGQKDNRNSRYNAPEYYQVGVTGELASTGTKAAAYKLWRENAKAKAGQEMKS
jgi:hypothetical protein